VHSAILNETIAGVTEILGRNLDEIPAFAGTTRQIIGIFRRRAGL